jgi:hypothetical protein
MHNHPPLPEVACTWIELPACAGSGAARIGQIGQSGCIFTGSDCLKCCTIWCKEHHSAAKTLTYISVLTPNLVQWLCSVSLINTA